MGNDHEEAWPEHKELFEVVLCKKGKAPSEALPPDFKRVAVTATSTYAAYQDPLVIAEKEHVAFAVTKPGFQTQEEVTARQREMNMLHPPVDRAAI